MTDISSHHFGQLALRDGLITPAQLEEALRLQASAGKAQLLGRILVERGYLTDKDVARVYTNQLLARKDESPNGAQVRKAVPAAGDKTLFGKYLLTEVLGKGLKRTYKVWDSDRKSFLALKLGPEADAPEEDKRRFRAEAEAAAGLVHPNIVQVHEVNEVNGRPYVLMDYVTGTSLAHLVHPDNRDPAEFATNKGTTRVYRHPKDDSLTGEIRKALKEKRPLQRDHLVRLVAEAARGVNFAHQHGVIHRDLKPHNIIADLQGRPVITDFTAVGPALSAAGGEIAVPAYLAPELVKGAANPADTAGDIYALGAILYECLTARPPYEGSAADVLKAIPQHDPPAPAEINPTIPPDLEAICLKAMARKRDLRYGTALELAEELERFLYGGTVQARSSGQFSRVLGRNRMALALGLLALAIVIAVALMPPGKPVEPVNPTASPDAAKAAQYCLEAKKLQGQPGQEQRALELYTQAILLQGGNMDCWYERGLLAYRMGRYDRVLKDFSYCAEKGRAMSGAYYFSGRIWMEDCLHRSRPLEEAEKQFKALLTDNIASPFAPLAQACLLALAGDHEKALHALDVAEPACAYPAEIHEIRAWICQHRTPPDLAQAIQWLGKAAEAAPKDERPWISRAHVLIQMGKYPEAVRDLDKALALSPAHIPVLKERGYLYCDVLKDPGKARDDLERAFKLSDPSDPVDLELRSKLSNLPPR